MHRLTLCYALPFVMLLGGCPADGVPEHASPTLNLLDTILLAESDSVFVGQPSGFAAPGDGTYLIADHRNATVHQYSEHGEHLRRIGRRGDGPGEFEAGPAAVVVDGDSLLLVEDGARFTVWDYPSASFRWRRRIPASAVPPSTPLAARQGQFFFRIVDRAQQTTVGIVSSDSDTPILGGPFPQLLGRSLMLDQLFSQLQVAPLGEDSVAVAVIASDYMFVGPLDGPFDSVRIPILKRRGSRPDLLEAIDDADPRTGEAAIYKPSLPFMLTRLSTGLLAYVVADLTHVPGRFSAKLYLSIVDPHHRQSCPDAEVPAPESPPPLVSFRGDTLLVLTQNVTDDLKATTAITRYLIDTHECRWTRTE